LQWLNPRGFTIFLNAKRALRDQRYKLIRYSKDELSLRLLNVTVHDEGIYKCFYYDIPFKIKNKTVEVLAAPSNPVLEASQDTEGKITLSCYTQGCKPQPQITWLVDNSIELLGDTKHQLEADGKKWATTSTLTVLAYRSNAMASCIVHHRALREEKLVASFHFEGLSRTDSRCGLISSGEGQPLSFLSSLSKTNRKLFNTTPASFIEQDLKSEGIKKKEKDVLLPVLVAALIFVLLLIVLLFMRKLKKAHGVWKR
ncbi:CRTAM protein, partial [Rhinopomastus cyanomelas]|nr:CRTAM protein [Rhinopomastus cyanomelas]